MLGTTYINRKQRNEFIQILKSIPSPKEEDSSEINHFVKLLSRSTSEVPYILRSDREKMNSLIEKYWNSTNLGQSTSISGQNNMKIKMDNSLMDESQTEYSVKLPKKLWKILLFRLETEVSLDSSIQSVIHIVRREIFKTSDMPVEQFLKEVEKEMQESIPYRDVWINTFKKNHSKSDIISVNPDDILFSFYKETLKITRELDKEDSVSEEARQGDMILQWLLRNEPSLDSEED